MTVGFCVGIAGLVGHLASRCRLDGVLDRRGGVRSRGAARRAADRSALAARTDAVDRRCAARRGCFDARPGGCLSAFEQFRRTFVAAPLQFRAGLRPGPPLRWLGGGSRRTESRAAPRRRGRPRARLHPRRGGLRQDDDDHAAHRLAGRLGCFPRRRDPRRHVHRQGGGRDEGAARRARRGRCRGAHLPRRGARAAPPLRTRLGRPDPADEGAAPPPDRERAAAAVQVPAGRRSRDRDRAREGPARRAGRLPRRRSAATSRRSRRTSCHGLPRVRAAEGASAARSTSRTCSSSRSGCSRRTSTPAATFRDRYRAFTVDEYQDVNLLQQTLLDLWLGARDDLCVVGDDYQSIYALHRRLARVAARRRRRASRRRAVVRLEENYRSTPQVLELANRLVPRLGGAEKVLRATRPARARSRSCGRSRRRRRRTRGSRSELRALADGGVPLEETAILCRTNARLADFEEVLHEAGLPFQGSSLLGRDAARRLLRLARARRLDRRGARVRRSRSRPAGSRLRRRSSASAS